jgi:LemA protein
MTSHWLFQLAVLAVGLSWLVGAYNRLMRLRNAVTKAWEQFEPTLQKRSEAMAVVVEAMREPLADEAGTLQSLQEIDARQRAAAAAVTQARARVEEVSLWVAAEAALASPASRLRALIDLHRPTDADGVPDATLAQALSAWAETEPRLGFARQAFNDAAQVYNRAVSQWPTRLLAGPFGFRLAGRT